MSNAAWGKTIEKAVWEAFAVGDAMGMATEFMTPQAIRHALGEALPGGLIPQAFSANHADLPRGSVTDDTEQNLYLLAMARERGRAEVEDTVEALKAWIRERDAVAKRYIGPSSVKALASIDQGLPPEEAGMGGTTCGGMMRTPAAVLWNPEQTEEEMEESIYRFLLPTHNSSEALEAAGAYGFALYYALKGADPDSIIRHAARGGERLKKRAPYEACAPSSVERIRLSRELAGGSWDQLLAHLYQLWGTGLPSADVCGAVFAIFRKAPRDPWLAIRQGTVIGGDTDTIAALAGALCTAVNGGHNIPREVVQEVLLVNRELFELKYPEVFEP